MTRSTVVASIAAVLGIVTAIAHIAFADPNALALVGIFLICLGLGLLCASRRSPHALGRQISVQSSSGKR